MKLLVITAVLSAFTVIAPAQTPVTPPIPSWRAGLSTLPATPPPNTSAQDINQFERNMRIAAAGFGYPAPNANVAQWEANRALVRRMAAYLAGLQVMAGNSALRTSIFRAQRTFDSLGFAPYLAYGMLPELPDPSAPPPDALPPPPPPQQTMPPPFALNAPESTSVSDADKDTSADLHTRYETDAARSAAVWQNAETIRLSLEARGMGLNADTGGSLARLPVHLNSAANSLRGNDWDGARTHLEQAEAETRKIAKTVGR